ncbi:MAG: hypothetical protein ACOYL6_08200 [Bacteriovoracaceae bacterium]
MKIVLPLMTVLLVATAHAQTSSTNSLFGGESTNSNAPSNLLKVTHAPNRSVDSLKSWKDVHKQLQQSPFHLSLMVNSNFSETYDGYTKGEQFKSNFIFNDAYLSYSPNRDHQFRLSPRFTSNIAERSHTETTFRHIALRYQRRNILTEANHHVSMSAEIHEAYYPDEKFRNSRGADGFQRAGLNFSRQFTPSFSLDLNLVNFINFKTTGRTNQSYSTVAQYYNRVILTPNYVFNDTYTGSLGLFYDHGVISDFANKNNTMGNKNYIGQTDSPKTDDFVWIDPALNVVINSWFNIDFDFAWLIYRSHDTKKGASGFYKKKDNRETFGYWVGAAFNFTVF